MYLCPNIDRSSAPFCPIVCAGLTGLWPPQFPLPVWNQNSSSLPTRAVFVLTNTPPVFITFSSTNLFQGLLKIPTAQRTATGDRSRGLHSEQAQKQSNFAGRSQTSPIKLPGKVPPGKDCNSPNRADKTQNVREWHNSGRSVSYPEWAINFANQKNVPAAGGTLEEVCTAGTYLRTGQSASVSQPIHWKVMFPILLLQTGHTDIPGQSG